MNDVARLAEENNEPEIWTARELSSEDHRGMGWIQGPGIDDVAAYGAMDFSMEENRRIGRLLAAAPELLEALKAALPILRSASNGAVAWGNAYEAIAKAEGRS